MKDDEEGAERGGAASDWNDPCFNGEVYRGKLSGVPRGNKNSEAW